MAANVLNTDAQLNGKTLVVAENAQTISGVQTFSAKPVMNAGIQFPAAQAASADANTLDDYEEGTWTPTLSSAGGGTPTYQKQVGKYVKIGRCVTYWGRITLTNKGTLAAGTIKVEALPFTSDSNADLLGFVRVAFWQGLLTAVMDIRGYVVPAGNEIVVLKTTAATTSSFSQMVVADIDSTFDLLFGGSYLAAQ